MKLTQGLPIARAYFLTPQGWGASVEGCSITASFGGGALIPGSFNSDEGDELHSKLWEEGSVLKG